MTRMRIVPEKMTVSMHNALLDKVASTDGFDNWVFHADAGYEAAIAASPSQGAVTAAQLEAAAGALLERWGMAREAPTCREEVEIVVAALGLAVQP